MSDYENPIPLCSDCSNRASGSATRRSVDEDYTCEWCGDDVGYPWFVEDQEDPGLRDWQKDRDSLHDWLEDHENTDDVRARDRVVDFTIGDMHDDWPGLDDDLNAIRSSSVSVGFVLTEEERFSEVKIHLPPARESLREEVHGALDLGEKFGVHYGSGRFGGTPAPDGVITPHIIGVEDATSSEVKEVAEQALEVYEEVYDEGEKAITSKPGNDE